MIVAVIVLAAVCGMLVGVVVALVRAMRLEREAWAKERRELVNRVVARHTGEAIALDRSDAPKEPREPHEQVLIEGLS